MIISRRLLLQTLASSSLISFSFDSAAQAGALASYEGPETRPVTDVLSASSLTGPHYKIGPTVYTFDYLNEYAVKSDYGDFTASSDAMLRRLRREIAAIAALAQVKQSDAFKKAALEAAKGPIRGAKNLINDPVKTVSAIPASIGSIFNRVGESIDRGGHSQYEDSTAASLLSVSSFKRDYAKKLGIDVYSSNPVLQEALNGVGWASAAGNLSISVVTVVSGSAALSAVSNIGLLDKAENIVASTPAPELSKLNRADLKNMAVTDKTADAFLSNKALSPRHQTLIVAAMKALGNIPGRAGFIAYAAGADSENAAFIFQQMAELLAGYHAKMAKLKKIDFSLTLPAALTAQKTIMLLPLDRLLWTQRASAVCAGLAKAKAPELWLTGTASARTTGELQAAKITLVEGAGKQIHLVD